MQKNDYWKLSAYESAKLIKDGSILAEDLVSSCIERVNQTNNKINAIVDDLGASALEKAHELDKLTKKGKFKGPLHGVPITIKENIDQEMYNAMKRCPEFNYCKNNYNCMKSIYKSTKNEFPVELFIQAKNDPQIKNFIIKLYQYRVINML